MSDHADIADNRIFATVSAGLAAVRRRPVLLPDCHCHFCDETLQPEILFCNDDCRDDYERLERARRINGAQ